MSIVIVRPIARPAINLNVPRGSTAVAKTTQTRKMVVTASSTAASPAVTESTRGTPIASASPGISHFNEQRGCDRAPELCDPVDDGELRCYPPRDEEAGRDGGIEVASGDMADGGDHDRDGKAVSERDTGQVDAFGGNRADADEDERERSDEFRGPAAYQSSPTRGRLGVGPDGAR